MLPTLNLTPDEAQALLLAEGDRLASRLIQHFPVGLHNLERAHLVGRTVAVTLVEAFLPTAETITRRLAQPLSLYVSADTRGRPELLAVNRDGEALEHLPVDELLERALYVRGRLHPQVRAELVAALQAENERGASLALVRLFRLPQVLDATRHYLNRYAGR
ncbi:hypothetical protein [Deinococcus sonorensis]|uniref:Uncharacterized protein n=2 Tax=Deinococcus sonorensis TaxID=309891 RepID=A0AAU7UED8_9DEIO